MDQAVVSGINIILNSNNSESLKHACQICGPRAAWGPIAYFIVVHGYEY